MSFFKIYGCFSVPLFGEMELSSVECQKTNSLRVFNLVFIEMYIENKLEIKLTVKSKGCFHLEAIFLNLFWFLQMSSCFLKAILSAALV